MVGCGWEIYAVIAYRKGMEAVLIFRNARRVLAALLVSILLLVSACAKAPSVLTRRNRKVASTEVVRRLLKKQHKVVTNRFFPAASDGFERVYTQEKKGFAEAKLKKREGM